MTKRQIIAIGGGGFSMEPENPLLDLYVLRASEKPKPKICFIPTASGDSADYIERFYKAHKKYDCQPTHLSLFQGTFTDLRQFILSQDILYVGGGNTRNMLVLWKEWGLDLIIREAYEKGIVCAGISAGSICWFEQFVTDSIPGKLTVMKGLHWIGGFCVPHFDGEAERRPTTIHKISTAEMCANGIGVDDGAAAHFIDEKLLRVVCSQEGKTAYIFSSAMVEPIAQKSILINKKI